MNAARNISHPGDPRLKVAHVISGCRTLGPGKRTVIWVRGCARRCPGCIATPILDAAPGPQLSHQTVVERVLAHGDDGLTVSGGEPFEQVAALTQLALAAQLRGLSVMVYTGYLLGELQQDVVDGSAAALAHIDLLVDGPYEQALRADLLWRGSRNQQLHFLTARHAGLKDRVGDPGAGLELRVSPESGLFWAGVPPIKFPAALATAARASGLVLTNQETVWA